MFPPLLQKLYVTLVWPSPKSVGPAYWQTPVSGGNVALREFRKSGKKAGSRPGCTACRARERGCWSVKSSRPGTLIRLLMVNAAHTFALNVELRVVRCQRIINGEFFIGGQFTRDVCHQELVPFIL